MRTAALIVFVGFVLLAGASAGLMGFAWSTGVLMTLAQKFQRAQLRLWGSLPPKSRSAPD
jgi:hypothetical protein